MGLFDMFTDNERLKNILLGILNMLLLLGVFLLGFNASHWTSSQIQQYCSVDWCNAYRANGGIINISYIEKNNEVSNITCCNVCDG